MDGILRDAARYDRLESLIKQRRYEESIELLNQIIATTPQDSDAYLYRSLVTRIVALREFCQNQRERPDAHADFKQWENERASNTAPNPTSARKRRRFGLTRGTAHDWGFRFALTASVLSMASIVTVLGTDLLLGKGRRLTASTQTPANLEQRAATIAAVESPPLGTASTAVENSAPPQPVAGGDNAPKIAATNRSEAGTKPSGTAIAKAKKKKPKGSHRAKAEGDGVDEAPAVASRPAKEHYASAANPLYLRARRPIAIRQAARFAAPTVEKFSEGTLVQVIGVKNSWAKIQLEGKEPGFVRIEFLGPADTPTARSEAFARLSIN
ncbi:MAG: hypothetical protein FJ145_07065 [Deltaproteobacteria bacterium]|nr:hypothetical protein [Deltaproteobacteria bacterium]